MKVTPLAIVTSVAIVIMVGALSFYLGSKSPDEMAYERGYNRALNDNKPAIDFWSFAEGLCGDNGIEAVETVLPNGNMGYVFQCVRSI